MKKFDLDPSASDLRIGIELEWPEAPSWDTKLTEFGRWSGSLRDEVRENGWPSAIGGRPVHDGTVGLEIVSPNTGAAGGMPLEDAWKWYADAVDYLEEEYNSPQAPCGVMGDSTAGLHIHLSSLSRQQARELYDISETSWAKALFCSSVATSDTRSDWSVFRGTQYCRFPGEVIPNSDSHYACVNARREGHYEWRLPEPVLPEHFEIIIKFIRLFEQDTEQAVQFAQEILDSGDDRVTSIRRAEAVGMDIEEQPTVRRMPVADSEDFYEAVNTAPWLPEIYTVSMPEQDYYLFSTRLEGAFDVEGIEFSHDDVLYADTLERVQDEDLRSDVQRSFNRGGTESIEETEATHVVKDIVKKKKGRA